MFAITTALFRFTALALAHNDGGADGHTGTGLVFDVSGCNAGG
jgi:hypothetical protein